MSKKNTVVLVAVALAVVLTILGYARKSRAIVSETPMPKSGVDLAANKVAAQSAIPTNKSSDLEAELVTVTPHGFEPSEITRPTGRFVLMVEDRSGLNTISSRLRLQAGLTLRNIPMKREQPNWSDVINLQPGRYVLSDGDHPDWVCHITITAQ
jgi:hypothetical protein